MINCIGRVETDQKDDLLLHQKMSSFSFGLLYLGFLPPNCYMQTKDFGEGTSSPEKVGTFHLDDCSQELVFEVLTKSQVLKGFHVLAGCT